MRKRPLAYIACVFLTGLVYKRYQINLLLLVIVGVIIWEIYVGRQARNVLKIAGRSTVLLSAFLLGIWHMEEGECFRAADFQRLSQQQIFNGEFTEYAFGGSVVGDQGSINPHLAAQLPVVVIDPGHIVAVLIGDGDDHIPDV